jgi:hypothetical protein
MYFFYGVISTVLTVIFEFILLQIPYSIHNKNLAFIIPAGGFIDGALCAVGLYLYLKLKDSRLKLKHCICAIVLAFTGFWSIYYMSYQTTYVFNGDINHTFRGEKITSYMYNNTENFSFLNYLDIIIKGTSFKATYYSGTLTEDYHFGHTFNTFVLIAECIGFCLGGLSIGAIALENRDTCKKCKDPFYVKKLYNFNPIVQVVILGI